MVSILIPCRNAEAWIGAALESVLSQSYKHLEVVIVDDASTDASLQIIRKFADPRLKVISKRCGSAAKARNVAFQNSTGEFIKFFDADDLLGSETVERQMDRLGHSRRAVASCEWGRFCKDDLATFRLSPQSVWRDMDARDWLVEAWVDAQPMMQPGLFLCSRDLINRCGLWNEALTPNPADDFEFFSRVLCEATDVRFTVGARLFYRSGLVNSLSQQKSRTAAESIFHSVMMGTEYLLEKRGDPGAQRSCANILQQCVYQLFPKHRDLRKALGERIAALGGSDLKPLGPPRFHSWRRIVGWKAARYLQEAFGKG